MRTQVVPRYVWLIPLLPLALALAIFLGEFQSTSFLFINRYTQNLPDTLWAWLTFLGNGWGSFAIAFPLILLAPRLLTAGIIAGAISALSSTLLKNFFDSPRPAAVLLDSSFHRLGEPLLHRAFPSGHTLTAFAIATALYFSCEKDKRGAMFLVFIIAALIGLSRNAVGAHWLTDVLGGAGFGMWCGMLGAVITNRIPDKYLSTDGLWLRIVAIGGMVAIYAHLTQIMDHELNLPLQYASIAVLVLTLYLFIRAQFSSTPSRPN